MRFLYVVSLSAITVTHGFYIKSATRIHQIHFHVSDTSLKNNQVAKFVDDTYIYANENVLETAMEYRRQGIPTKALSLLQSILLDHDRSNNSTLETLAEIHYQIGCNYNDMGCVKESIDSFQKVVELETQMPSFHHTTSTSQISIATISKANVLLDGFGTREESHIVFKSACHPGPCSLLAAMTADSLGLHNDAQRYYEQALVFSPFDTDAMIGMLCHYETFGCIHDREINMKETLKEKVPRDALLSLNYVLKQNISNLECRHYFTYDMIRLGLENVSIVHGLVMEFGVYFGKTLRMIASHFDKVDPSIQIHGFDTFDGLPEDWRGTKAGSYSTEGLLPNVGDNVKYHVGLFRDQLTSFLEDLRMNELKKGISITPVSFLNIDCDLYSSTIDVLIPLAKEGRIVPGTILVFDEYVMNPKWQEDEFKAFQEVSKEYKWNYEYIAISLATGQAVIKIT